MDQEYNQNDVETIAFEVSDIQKNDSDDIVLVMTSYQNISHSSIRLKRLSIHLYKDTRTTFEYTLSNESNHRTRTTWCDITRIETNTGHVIPNSNRRVFMHTFEPGKGVSDKEVRGFWRPFLQEWWSLVSGDGVKIYIRLSSRRGS